MLLLDEAFWCPTCGRLPRSECTVYVAPGLCDGWTSITCNRCMGVDGDLVCSGETQECLLSDDGKFCIFHGNYVGEHPHPSGKTASYWRQRGELRLRST